jgi:hypothetical protein
MVLLKIAFIIPNSKSWDNHGAEMRYLRRLALFPPSHVTRSVAYDSPLDATVEWQLSNRTDKYINTYSYSGPGGSLAEGVVVSGYDSQLHNYHVLRAETMGIILSKFGQAYFSLMRQNVENANQARTPDLTPDKGIFVKMVVSVPRVGSSPDAWLTP